MSSATARIEARLRLLEGRLGIDREGRTVSVWLLPRPDRGHRLAGAVPV